MLRTTSVFAILCACDCIERFKTWKVIFEFTDCIKKKELAPRPLKFTLFKSPGFKYNKANQVLGLIRHVCYVMLSMHVRAFIMFLLWSKKEYGLLNQICEDWVFEVFQIMD